MSYKLMIEYFLPFAKKNTIFTNLVVQFHFFSLRKISSRFLRFKKGIKRLIGVLTKS